jgi:hypothetical protein
MKQVAISDFMTDAMVKKAIAIYTNHHDTGELHIRLINLLMPHMAEINRKLGQKNDAGYLAYALEYALSKSRE